MNVECKDLQRILLGQEPEEMKALEAHAATCDACREELRAWNEISAAAPALRKSWESPNLWPRIHQALAEESQAARARGWNLGALWMRWSTEWRAAVAVLVLMAISGGSVYLLTKRIQPRSDGERVIEATATEQKQTQERRLLTEQAVREVEQNEAAYMASIDKLAKLAEPRLQKADTPLMLSYREKLVVLDAAIAELRAGVEQNQLNAHLRSELRELYQEKQSTLREVLREDR